MLYPDVKDLATLSEEQKQTVSMQPSAGDDLPA
jgi:hypothetical protein